MSSKANISLLGNYMRNSAIQSEVQKDSILASRYRQCMRLINILFLAMAVDRPPANSDDSKYLAVLSDHTQLSLRGQCYF